MANPIITAAPIPFEFQGLSFVASMVSFSGSDPRRGVSHQFLKRRGAKIEDMSGGPREIELDVQFVGDITNTGSGTRTPSQRYEEFARLIAKNPYGLLVHPIAGQWQAFCHGPQYDVNFARATNQVAVRVKFSETELDAPVSDVPVVGTAAQNVTMMQTAFQVAVGTFLGVLAKAEIAIAETQAQIDAAIGQLAFVEAPMTFMQGVISSGLGTTTALIGKVSGVVTRGNIFNATIDDYVDQAVNAGAFFTGVEAPPGGLTSTETLLGGCLTSGQDLSDQMVLVSASPGSAADSVGSVEETMASCVVLADALRAASPPVITYVVPAIIDLLTLCQRRYKTNATSRAADIMGMNRIQNTALIAAGTRLLIPSR